MFECRKLIVSAGAWINHVLGSIGLHIPVYVTQEQVTYFATPHIKEFTKEKYTKIIKSLQFSILIPLHQYTYTYSWYKNAFYSICQFLWIVSYPIWIYHSEKYDFYGLPIHGNSGSKIGIDAGGPVVTADSRNFTPDPVREQACIDHLKKTIPRVNIAEI